MNIVLLGAPGSGKGTQAELLVKKYNLHYFQTGKLAREIAKSDREIREMVNSGKLIPEKMMTKYVTDHLTEKYPERNNILFEGYPRFITQYLELLDWLSEKGQKINAVISLDVTEDTAVARISSRRICEQCGEVYNLITNPPPEGKCKCGGKLIQRDDDKPESIKVRFEYYRKHTEKLIEYVDKKGDLIRVDGERPIDEIQKDIIDKLENKWKN